MKSKTLPIAFLALLFSANPLFADPVPVFILAGQSNMEGKGRVKLMETQAKSERFRKDYQHLRNDGDWIERDDVLIKYLDRKGKLTVGYGSRDCIGPELQFGWTMGDHFEQPVLLIKTAWGGKSLARDFRPPSSGMPSDEELEALLERARKRKPETTMDDIKASFGFYYRAMLDDVAKTLESKDELFPELKGMQTKLAGFVWFQGWNDMVNQQYTAEYAENMANFIRDVRKDLNSPGLPFVIGQLGVDGEKPKRPNPKKDAFKAAQAAPVSLDEFKGNVFLVRTDQYWDMEADEVFRRGWKENLEEWNKVGSDRPYHYLGSARCHMRMGKAFALALLNKQSDDYTPPAPKEEKPAEPAASFYKPKIRKVEGWTIKVDPQLENPKNKEVADKAFKALANHLQRIEFIVPPKKLAQLKKLPIWIELDNQRLKNMQYHPGRGWLISNRHDPELVKHVHIPVARNLYDPHMWAKHPYVVLHELAHAYHDQYLDFDNARIRAVYEAAKEQGIYEEVISHTGRKVKHYGLNNPMEYFAESTEAYFGVNDFYPFVRAELKEHDPRMYALLEEIWGKID